MKVECLYPELCNRYGEAMTMEMLKKTFHTVSTPLNDEPAFLKGDVDLVFMGPMTSRSFYLVVEKLKNHQEALEEYLNKGKVFIAMGNALDVFLEESHKEDQTYYGLSMIKGKVHFAQGQWEKATFTYRWEKVVGLLYPDRILEVDKDITLMEREGGTPVAIKKDNFFGFNLAGPLLLQNPNFFKLLLSDTGHEVKSLYEESLLKEIYVKRMMAHQK